MNIINTNSHDSPQAVFKALPEILKVFVWLLEQNMLPKVYAVSCISYYTGPKTYRIQKRKLRHYVCKCVVYLNFSYTEDYIMMTKDYSDKFIGYSTKGKHTFNLEDLSSYFKDILNVNS